MASFAVGIKLVKHIVDCFARICISVVLSERLRRHAKLHGMPSTSANRKVARSLASCQLISFFLGGRPVSTQTLVKIGHESIIQLALIGIQCVRIILLTRLCRIVPIGEQAVNGQFKPIMGTLDSFIQYWLHNLVNEVFVLNAALAGNSPQLLLITTMIIVVPQSVKGRFLIHTVGYLLGKFLGRCLGFIGQEVSKHVIHDIAGSAVAKGILGANIAVGISDVCNIAVYIIARTIALRSNNDTAACAFVDIVVPCTVSKIADGGRPMLTNIQLVVVVLKLLVHLVIHSSLSGIMLAFG